MYYNDHAPPHFHARYDGQKATFEIATGDLLEGSLSRRALGLVKEWAILHQTELVADWELARQLAPLRELRRWSEKMLHDIVEVRPLDGYKLFLRFDDGAEGIVDVAQQVRLDGVFEWLRERANFVQVRVDFELGTIVWPNGADLDADVLHSVVTGQPIVNRQTSGTV